MPRTLAVVLPTYNRKAYLLEALRGFLQEELLPGWELKLIVVDDGGRDFTREALNEAGLLSQITYIYQDNAERAVARNRGAELALSLFHADWLLFFDSDDLIAKGSLKLYLERAESCAPEVVGIYGEIEVWLDQTTPQLTPLKDIRPSGDLSKRILQQPVLPLGATLVRAQSFQSLGGFHEDPAMVGSEDFHFLVRLAFLGPILSLQQKTVFYRQHGTNTHPKNYLRSTEAAVRHLEAHIQKKFSGLALTQAHAQLKILAQKGQIGALNQPGHRQLAFYAWLDLMCRYPQCLLEWRSLRLFLSLVKSAVLDLVRTRLPLRE